MRVRWFGHFGRLLQAQGSPDFRHQVSITEHADDTPTGKLMEAIIESVDEFCSENLIWGTAAMDKVDPGRVEKVFPLSSQRPWSAASTVWCDPGHPESPTPGERQAPTCSAGSSSATDVRGLSRAGTPRAVGSTTTSASPC